MLEVQDSRIGDYWRIGTYGHLCLRDSTSNPFTFYVYADQRLRRKPECDIIDARLWCWAIEEVEGNILVKQGIIPGEGGRVIEEETEQVTVNVPLEFFDLCESRGVNANQVLRGFIADVYGHELRQTAS